MKRILVGTDGSETATGGVRWAAVLADAIGLLSTFVGEDLVLPLVQQAWGTAMLTEDRPGPKVINE